MDEGQETTQTQETSTEDSGAGVQPKATSPIDRANEAAERLEAANKQMQENLNRQEELYAKQQLEGKAEAGKPEEKRDETPAEYRKRVEAEIRAGKTEFD